MKAFLINAGNWYAQYERPISTTALVFGYIFNIITLKRVDLFWENVWFFSHFFFIAFFLILVNRQENEDMDEKDASKKHFWYLNILQFFFGGLLSSFVVFYFRSTTLSATWPFLLVVSVASAANETLKKHYSRLVFQVSLFYISLLAFAIFIVPVVFRRIGPDIFLISSAVSLVFLSFLLLAINHWAKEKFKQSKKILAFSIANIFIITNVLYFLNLIPPIPLSLKDGGVYHSLRRDKSGNYIAEAEKKGTFDFLSDHEDFNAVKGSPIYAYSAVFSPTSFNTQIVHVWQKYDEQSRKWVTANRINLSTVGGRDGGYRTYSYKSNYTPGKWRVNVETPDHKIIGRLRFDVTMVNTETALVSETLE